MEEWDGIVSDDTLASVVKGLGWFSIALGVVELVAPRKLHRALGLGHHEAMTRGFGLREIAAGVGILATRDPTPAVWSRVAGDALDLASLAPTLRRSNPHRAVAAGAFANVVAITVLDIACALALSRRRAEHRDRSF
ncbi:hypothetical protein [Aureimonas psammosilenae]|uniref:hypothetical protein n=1 Tax=Aureimonas psammosilenae TaxID=2495496 RepID=UPI001F180916|nr:hypothetical protein [Aureimonas psammosilenae]